MFNINQDNNKVIIGSVALVVLIAMIWFWSANQINAPSTASLTTPEDASSQANNTPDNNIAPNNSGSNPTETSTGLTNDFIRDSFFLPLGLIVLMLYLFFSGKLNRFADWIGIKR